MFCRRGLQSLLPAIGAILRSADEHFDEVIVQGIVERTQVRIDFLFQSTGEKSEPLTRLHHRPHQHDALDTTRLKRLDGACNRQVGLASTRRTGEGDQTDLIPQQDLAGQLELACAPYQVGRLSPQVVCSPCRRHRRIDQPKR